MKPYKWLVAIRMDHSNEMFGFRTRRDQKAFIADVLKRDPDVELLEQIPAKRRKGDKHGIRSRRRTAK